MKISETGFKGLLIFTPNIFRDNRGYFFESYNSNVLGTAGITFTSVQDNESRSAKGVIRGLHYQLKPFDQTKLIRVIEGNIYDVVVDLRRNSETFGKWFGIELDSEKKQQLFIPKGFAHGFSVLSEYAIIHYKCDNRYSPQHERGISPFDPSLGIDWRTGMATPVTSGKDMKNPPFAEAEYDFEL